MSDSDSVPLSVLYKDKTDRQLDVVLTDLKLQLASLEKTNKVQEEEFQAGEVEIVQMRKNLQCLKEATKKEEGRIN